MNKLIERILCKSGNQELAKRVEELEKNVSNIRLALDIMLRTEKLRVERIERKFERLSDTKVCTRCGKELPIDQFSKDRTKKSGMRSSCKECENEFRRKKNAIKKAQKLYVCSKCGELLTADKFYKSKHSRTGVSSWCKNCHKEYNKEYIYNKQKDKQLSLNYTNN